MIPSYRLILEYVSERQPRTMKDIFNSIYTARASIFRTISTLQRLRFSESSSISKTRRKDGIVWVLKILQNMFAKNGVHLTAIEVQNIQFQHLKIILFGRNTQKVGLCFTCYKKEHATDYQQQDDVELVIHCSSRGFHEYQRIWQPTLGQKMNIKRKKRNLFHPYVVGLYCETKGKLECLTLVERLFRQIRQFRNYLQGKTANLMQLYAHESSVEVHYCRVAQKYSGSKFQVGKVKATMEIFSKMKVFVLDNFLDF